MKILIWTQYFWPETFHINEVARALVEQGDTVTVFTGKPNYPDGAMFSGYRFFGVDEEDFHGISVIRIPLVARGQKSTVRLILNYLSFIIFGYVLGPFLLRKKSFDIIYVYAPSPLLQALPALVVSWCKGIPLVLWVQDLWPDALKSTGFITNAWLLRLVERVVRFIYKRSDSLLIQSEGFRSSVERLTGQRNNIHFFPNSSMDIASGVIGSDRGVQIARSINEAFSLVFAGNIGSAQDCEIIVEVADCLKEYKDIRFYLVGSGSMTDQISRSIKKRNLKNIYLPGRVSAEDMAAIYSSASVLLLTLRDDPALAATIPSKLQSYLAAGRPILVSSNGESANVVRRADAGLVCPAGDVKALADAVQQIYNMRPEERARFGGNGRAFFLEHYYLPDRIRELRAHFEAVVGVH